MFVKNLEDCKEFRSNDGCHLRELLHSRNDPVELPYSIAVARVEANESTYKHKLEQTEVYYIISGSGLMYIDKEVKQVKQGDVILIPPGAIQWMKNTGNIDINFIAIVNPPWTMEQDIRVL